MATFATCLQWASESDVDDGVIAELQAIRVAEILAKQRAVKQQSEQRLKLKITSD